mmetsp:Transcript_3301/g.6157  ORF Transcript_3301/g.6157 Transcript_3301/m.6157 type:complete len:311 (-) Transcript_3301:1112-2044(-)
MLLPRQRQHPFQVRVLRAGARLTLLHHRGRYRLVQSQVKCVVCGCVVCGCGCGAPSPVVQHGRLDCLLHQALLRRACSAHRRLDRALHLRLFVRNERVDDGLLHGVRGRLLGHLYGLLNLLVEEVVASLELLSRDLQRELQLFVLRLHTDVRPNPPAAPRSGDDLVLRAARLAAQPALVDVRERNRVVMAAAMVADSDRIAAAQVPLVGLHRLRAVRVNLDPTPIDLRHGLDFHIVSPLAVLAHALDVVLHVPVDVIREEAALRLDIVHALLPHHVVIFGVAIHLVADRTEQTVAVPSHVLDAPALFFEF